MRRFRRRRRRIAAAALLPLAATLTTSAFAQAPTEGKNARIDASKRTVSIGRSVTLRGAFPGAANAPIEIRYRAQGAEPVAVDVYALQQLGYRVILDNLVEEHGVLRHNSAALAQLLFEEFLSVRKSAKTRR